MNPIGNVSVNMNQITLCTTDKGIFVDGQMQLAALKDDVVVGCVDLYNYDPINLRAEVGIVVAAEHRRQGVGKAILMELEKLCRTTLHLHQLYCDVAAPNVASQRLFEACGYVQCGWFKQWIATRKGFVDTYRFQIIL